MCALFSFSLRLSLDDLLILLPDSSVIIHTVVFLHNVQSSKLCIIYYKDDVVFINCRIYIPKTASGGSVISAA